MSLEMDGKRLLEYLSVSYPRYGMKESVALALGTGRADIDWSDESLSRLCENIAPDRFSQRPHSSRRELSDMIVLDSVMIGRIAERIGKTLPAPIVRSVKYAMDHAQSLRDPDSHLGAVGE